MNHAKEIFARILTALAFLGSQNSQNSVIEDSEQQADLGSRRRQVGTISLGAIIIGILAVIAFWADSLTILESLSARLVPPTPTSIPTSTPVPYFDFYVRIVDASTDANVPGAQITIELAGQPPHDEYSDSNGFVRFRIPTKYQGEWGRLRVQAEGYILYDQHTNLESDRLLETIKLTPKTQSLIPTQTESSLVYNLPPALLTRSSDMFASPNRSELVVSATLPVGETIYVMGRNETTSHLRVVWRNAVGWVPISVTSYDDHPLLNSLPVFDREPPACAEPIVTQFGLNSVWVSDRVQRIVIVVNLFRSRYGPFPESSLVLRVNGIVVEDTRRQIVERGQFPLKDIVFTPPQDIQPGDTVGYQLNTPSDELLSFTATIFGVPQNCQWGIH